MAEYVLLFLLQFFKTFFPQNTLIQNTKDFFPQILYIGEYLFSTPKK